jgi:hypothetical protein
MYWKLQVNIPAAVDQLGQYMKEEIKHTAGCYDQYKEI